MAAPVAFYFDFSSPYGYFASFRIDRIAKDFGREVDWKPILIGAAFKESGNRPLLDQPLKGDYCLLDWQRLARLEEVPWTLPERFPIAALAPSRVYWWLHHSHPEKAKPFARAVWHAYFGQGHDITDPEVVAEAAAPLGIDRDDIRAVNEAAVWKQRLKDETSTAIQHGVFGSPFFIIDGEPFWGWDRMAMVRRWLETGGW